jgi:hypothetical protein
MIFLGPQVTALADKMTSCKEFLPQFGVSLLEKKNEIKY